MRISPLALRGKAKATAKAGGAAQPDLKSGPGAQRLDLNKLGMNYLKELKDRCGCLQVVCVRGMNNKVSRFVEGGSPSPAKQIRALEIETWWFVRESGVWLGTSTRVLGKMET